MGKARKTSRKNVTRSCLTCKKKKVKCTGHLGPKPCENCKKRNISADDCIFEPPTRRGPQKKKEVIDSNDPPESFTDNEEVDAFLQFDDISSESSSQSTTSQDLELLPSPATETLAVIPITQDIHTVTHYLLLATVTRYIFLPGQYTPAPNPGQYSPGQPAPNAPNPGQYTLAPNPDSLFQDNLPQNTWDLAQTVTLSPGPFVGAPSLCDFQDVPCSGPPGVLPAWEALEVTGLVTPENEFDEYSDTMNAISNVDTANAYSHLNETTDDNMQPFNETYSPGGHYQDDNATF
ncbi:28193_t:CDS:2 [Dentiscutata erythropus]|uniref:28193_t:CDS:1 n=1 Tax=Dentiscutata erythropus TaxID=1348616 RepID=A0A9N9AYE0_9GLOM|nr:28193_t:CDS:2 [Dentiscutata erythropus]